MDPVVEPLNKDMTVDSFDVYKDRVTFLVVPGRWSRLRDSRSRLHVASPKHVSHDYQSTESRWCDHPFTEEEWNEEEDFRHPTRLYDEVRGGTSPPTRLPYPHRLVTCLLYRILKLVRP